MTYNVILSKKDNSFIARVKEWPDVVVEKPTREEAVEQVKARLVEYLTQQVEIIPIDIDLPVDNGNPWLKNFGRFASDPTFDDLQAEIAAYRQAIDKE
ncbi:MAG: hypothetical protein H6631_01995 [Anaerolineaceae bacterium]|nr:hypothetical protein [Anaerolineaceae bacterium]MCB9099435.1 hypothetical protein [Anaerolineales bacterium]